jgi:pimeloyl-ACP methyl ester carboxylesterase
MNRRSIAAGLVLAATTCLGSLTSAANAGTLAGVETRTVCFAAHNGVVPARVLGTRFEAARSDTRRVILLVHGHSVTGRFWDWTPYYSVARRLARAGYLVISYDRLTAGSSTFPAAAALEAPAIQIAAGNTVTFDSDRAMIAEIVQQIRRTYRLPTTSPAGPCPASESAAIGRDPKIVLIGHSLGGALVSGYPGEWGQVAPVDALIQAGWSNAGSSDEATEVVDAKAISPANLDARQLSLFLDDGSKRNRAAISAATCAENKRLLLSPPFDAAVACEPSTFETVPYVDFVSAVAASQENQGFITQTPAGLPVLLAWADEDAFFPSDPRLSSGRAGCGAAGCQKAESQYWLAHCPCSKHVTEWTEKNAGHAFVWSSTMPSFTDEVVVWLRANGLGQDEL